MKRRPRCPKCGEPAREVEMTARATCVLTEDGSAGKVLSASRLPGIDVYICGGNHRWELTPAICKKCESPLTRRGYCRDETCHFSDRKQDETYTEG